MVRNGPPYLSVKKNSGGQREEGHEGAVPQKSSENKNGPEWSPLLVRQKKNSGG